MQTSSFAQGFVPFNRPRQIDTSAFQRSLSEIFELRWFTNEGKFCRELAQEIAALHGVKHCILVANATLGLQLVLKALVSKGSVVTTPFSFIATGHAIAWEHLQPVFCDIDEETLTLDPRLLQGKLSDQVRGILGVHVFGQPCHVDEIKAIADSSKIPVIYDAAHCFHVDLRGKSIGNFGEAEVLSFHATKLFHTFEGGAILTNSDVLKKKLCLMRNFGIEGMDQISSIGTNAKLNEVSAAYGLCSLPNLDATIARLRTIQAAYRDRLGRLKEIRVFQTQANVYGNYQYMPIILNERSPITRDELWAFLWNNGVQTRRYFYPLISDCPPYQTQQIAEDLPVATRIAANVLCLPCYFDLRDSDIEKTALLIREALSDPDHVKTTFRGMASTKPEDVKEPLLLPVISTLSRDYSRAL